MDVHVVFCCSTHRSPARGNEARAASYRNMHLYLLQKSSGIITAAVYNNFFAPKQHALDGGTRSKAARWRHARRRARRRCCSARRRCARRRHAQRRRTLNGGTLEPRRRHCCRRKEFFSCFTELLQITVVTRRRRDHTPRRRRVTFAFPVGGRQLCTSRIIHFRVASPAVTSVGTFHRQNHGHVSTD